MTSDAEKPIELQNRRRLKAILVPVAVLCLAAWFLYVYAQDSSNRAAVGKAAPQFTLPDLNGRPVSLADFRGKVVMINFWASWCEPCRDEAADLQAFYERYGDQVALLGINLREPVDLIERFRTQLGVRYPVLRDVNEQVARQYGKRGVPESWFIDPDGVARIYYLGPMTFAQMEAALAQTLAASGRRGPVPAGQAADG